MSLRNHIFPDRCWYKVSLADIIHRQNIYFHHRSLSYSKVMYFIQLACLLAMELVNYRKNRALLHAYTVLGTKRLNRSMFQSPFSGSYFEVSKHISLVFAISFRLLRLISHSITCVPFLCYFYDHHHLLLPILLLRGCVCVRLNFVDIHFDGCSP